MLIEYVDRECVDRVEVVDRSTHSTLSTHVTSINNFYSINTGIPCNGHVLVVILSCVDRERERERVILTSSDTVMCG